MSKSKSICTFYSSLKCAVWTTELWNFIEILSDKIFYKEQCMAVCWGMKCADDQSQHLRRHMNYIKVKITDMLFIFSWKTSHIRRTCVTLNLGYDWINWITKIEYLLCYLLRFCIVWDRGRLLRADIVTKLHMFNQFCRNRRRRLITAVRIWSR